MLSDLDLKTFLAQTASGTPTPGGGSMAALSASVSASLIEMVANLTIGKKGYSKVEDTMKGIAKKAHVFREKFIIDIDRDADAYGKVMAAYRLPSVSEIEKGLRKKAVQNALKDACLGPLNVAAETFKLIDFAKTVMEEGNKNALTDGIVALMMAKTAIIAALYNVKTNLTLIEDRQFTSDIGKQAVCLEKDTINMEREILSKVKL